MMATTTHKFFKRHVMKDNRRMKTFFATLVFLSHYYCFAFSACLFRASRQACHGVWFEIPPACRCRRRCFFTLYVLSIRLVQASCRVYCWAYSTKKLDVMRAGVLGFGLVYEGRIDGSA